MIPRWYKSLAYSPGSDCLAVRFLGAYAVIPAVTSVRRLISLLRRSLGLSDHTRRQTSRGKGEPGFAQGKHGERASDPYGPVKSVSCMPSGARTRAFDPPKAWSPAHRGRTRAPRRSPPPSARPAALLRLACGLPSSVSWRLGGRLADEHRDAGAGCLGALERQRALVVAVSEEALSGSEDERVDHEPVLIDQLVRHQRVHERAAAVDEDVVAGLLLQVGDRVDDVAAEAERRGRDCGRPAGTSSQIRTRRGLPEHGIGQAFSDPAHGWRPPRPRSSRCVWAGGETGAQGARPASSRSVAGKSSPRHSSGSPASLATA